ncbi:death-on-curing protein [Lacibacter cauensis]|uniref:Death-on-curing protein n=1 Tax=Lacibacter cauensis TaxID=510947 RepID=A0A562SKE5_9BACT|nr:type II toxin-antitoxin system death-on-curing family toxin [Lacibacter cauensis]TWI81583.1 death-on-curing protein [Lacibacter cauensis]
MILIEDILELHRLSIKFYGGAEGVRDSGLLESAIGRPFQTFGGNDLYATIFEKAAALGESLIVNHPFVDGNKRTGFLAMVALVESEGFRIIASQEEAYTFTIAISTGVKKVDEIVEWLRINSKA